MSMRPRDLAKLGHLSMNGGLWEGKQLAPAEYVGAATETRVQTTDDRGYGYLWSRLPFGYAALGAGERQIIVIPWQQLEVVLNPRRTWPSPGYPWHCLA